MQTQRLKPDSNYAGSSPPVAAARRSHSTAQIARSVNAPCACGGGCPRCSDNRLRGDFSQVRFHPSAPEVTGPLRARAVTMGQDIYFRPGEFRPGTPAGEKLIAHELAHTLQAPSGSRPDAIHTVSQPGDAFEKNADALASGTTDHALSAPSGLGLRSPLDGESADDRSRRDHLLQAIENAQANLIRLLRTGGLLARTEMATERAGIAGVIVPVGPDGDGDFLSYPARDALIRRIIRNLIRMATQFRTTLIPSTLPPAELDPQDDPAAAPSYSTRIVTSPTSGAVYSGFTADWAQLQAAYELFRISQGQVGEAYEADWYYLKPDLAILPGAARGARRASRGVASGAYVVVPDMANDPTRYIRIDGFTPIPRGGSPIIELWHDDFGYFYMDDERRIDVASPWSSDLARTR